MILKPQDIYILLKLIVLGDVPWSYSALAGDLFMSTSEVHAGLKRAVVAKLMDPQRGRPVKMALEEFLIHGVKYAFPPDRGGLTRGLPTAYAAAPLKEMISQPEEPPPVWPDLEDRCPSPILSPDVRRVQVTCGLPGLSGGVGKGQD